MNFWTCIWILGIIVGIDEANVGMILTYTFFLIINLININNKKKGIEPIFSFKKIKKSKDITIKNEKKYIIKQEKYNHIFTLKISTTETEELRKKVSCVSRDESLKIGRILWDLFYKDAYDKMIEDSNVKKLTGIYKITNTKNNKIYIGQAVNIGERWRQHIKAGIGAEFPSGNQMYKDMLIQGPETFTFEVQEKCEKSNLNAREMYWINYYNAYQNGYNQTRGNKN